MDVITDLWPVFLPIITAIGGWIANWIVSRNKITTAQTNAEIEKIELKSQLDAEKAKLLHEEWKYKNLISFFTPDAPYEVTSKEIIDTLPVACKECAELTIDWIEHLFEKDVHTKIREIYSDGIYTFALVSTDFGVIVNCGGVILTSDRKTIINYSKDINTNVYEI